MATAIRGEPCTWASEGTDNNPTNTDVLATTGALPTVGDYQLTIVVSSDATAVINYQWRNAADNGNVEEQRLFMGASSTIAFTHHARVEVANQRFRVIANATVTGNVCATLYWQKVN